MAPSPFTAAFLIAVATCIGRLPGNQVAASHGTADLRRQTNLYAQADIAMRCGKFICPTSFVVFAIAGALASTTFFSPVLAL